MKEDIEELEEYTLEELIEPEDLEYLQRMHPDKVPIYISKWVAQEKREEALEASPPATYEVEALTPKELARTVQESQEKIDQGDFSGIMGLLTTQAVVLENLFQIYFKKMISTEFLGAQEIFSRIAFRAQSQARKTIKTLVELKNPKNLTFIKEQSNTQINVKQTS